MSLVFVLAYLYIKTLFSEFADTTKRRKEEIKREMLHRILSSAERDKQRNRKEKLAELADIVKGEYKFSKNVAPVLPILF